MLFILAGLIIGFVVVGIYIYREFRNVADAIFTGILGGLFGAFIGFCVASLYSLDSVDARSEPQYLVNLKDGSSITGDFFIGIGHVDEEMKYSFYVETEDNIFELKTIEADEAKISYIKEGERPYLTTHCDDYSALNPKLRLWSDRDCFFNDIIFYVPKGSIKSDYELDAE